MSMYKKVDTSLNFVEREKEIVEYWNEKKVFEKSMQAKEGNDEFSFYDGPPTANGKPLSFKKLSITRSSCEGRCLISISERTNSICLPEEK